MIFSHQRPKRSKQREAIFNHHLTNEDDLIQQLIQYLDLNNLAHKKIQIIAQDIVIKVRGLPHLATLDAFLKEYDLSTEEGITIMCIAESILRIPDADTGNALIQDKLSSANWSKHVGHSSSLFVNASTWAFLLSGKMLRVKHDENSELEVILSKIISQSSKPVIRQAVQQAIKLISNHFIISSNIHDSYKKSKEQSNAQFRYSFDMLGEAAITSEDAEKYFEKYLDAIRYLKKLENNNPVLGPGVSIKLSALHPRFEYHKYESIFNRLYPRLKSLANEAMRANIGLVIDAEETDRLDIQLDLFKALCQEPDLRDWNGLGIAVQAYQKRAFYVIDWLIELAESTQRRLMIRLVKGAYWDSEIKRAQLLGLESFPVYTRKESTDISYLACAKKILSNTDVIFPMFATHNAHTISAILHLVNDYRDFEFQRLFGMGEQLYSLIISSEKFCYPCRVYAPCGEYKELLPYLVRRLLENGANSSFVNQILDLSIPTKEVVSDPVLSIKNLSIVSNPKIPLPKDIYQPNWLNSKGMDLTQENTLLQLKENFEKNFEPSWNATSIINGIAQQGETNNVYSPSNHAHKIGKVTWADKKDVNVAIQYASQAFPSWSSVSAIERTNSLNKFSKLLELHTDELIALCILEAGKTVLSAIAEVREAIDFCHYYAYQSKKLFNAMHDQEGSIFKVHYIGCGVFACISPWNFPLAIFVGQIVAALVTGNTVIAKPAEQTPLVATRVIELLHQAGIPNDVLQLIIGNGEIGASIVSSHMIAGVVFTGSTYVAHEIRKAVCDEQRCCIPVVAETGGVNAMIIDSSALLEQAVVDVIQSAFDSAGQRCSALRVVYVQEDIAEEFLRLLKGAMAELEIGNPILLSTDVGPIIDQSAKNELEQYEQQISVAGKLIYKSRLTSSLRQGNFFGPCVYEIDSIDQITKEAFGPILHIIRYPVAKNQDVINEINSTGYGLTLGIQSRINSFSKRMCNLARVGNIYINRNMIGATVGIQPFGGERMSGTGPKAGGPNYLYKFTHEQRIALDSSNTKFDNQPDLIKHKEIDEDIIAPSVNACLSSKSEDIKITSQNIDLKAQVTYSDQEHINQAILIAGKNISEFDEKTNEQRADYISYIFEGLTKYQNKIIHYYSAEFGLDRNSVANEICDALSIVQDYIKLVKNNFRKNTFGYGPVGERNEFEMHNYGIFVFYSDKDPYILGFISALSATIAIGNPLLVISNRYSLFTSSFCTKFLIHPDLFTKHIHYLPIVDKLLLENVFSDQRISGYICSTTTAYLKELENLLVKREGPLTPLIIDTDNRDTGGPLANPNNLYLIGTERTISTNTTAIGGNASLYCIER